MATDTCMFCAESGNGGSTREDQERIDAFLDLLATARLEVVAGACCLCASPVDDYALHWMLEIDLIGGSD